MRRTFGISYEDYARRVGRWLPRRPGEAPHVPWPSFLAVLRNALTGQGPLQGANLRILTETVVSPTLGAQLQSVVGWRRSPGKEHDRFDEGHSRRLEPSTLQCREELLLVSGLDLRTIVEAGFVDDAITQAQLVHRHAFLDDGLAALGRLLGVLDLSTTWDRAHPLGLSTAMLLARNLSLLLPPGAGDSDQSGLHLRTLGAVRATLAGRELVLVLPPRHVDLVRC